MNFKPCFIKTSARVRRAAGFTLIELLTVIAIIGILAAILIPVAGSVRETAKIAQASSNVREIGTLTHVYMEQNGGYLPTDLGSSPNHPYWLEALWEVLDPNREFPPFSGASHGNIFQDSIFHTPQLEDVAVDGRQPRSFGWNLEMRRNTAGSSGSGIDRARFAAFEAPSQTICLSDSVSSSTIRPGNNQVNYRNKGKALFLFLDGHVALLAPTEVPANANHIFWGGTETEMAEPSRR